MGNGSGCNKLRMALTLSITVPDKNGKYANVVLGHDSIDHVVQSPEPFLNTTIGRYGNRIAKGKFTLFGEEHELTVNNGPNSCMEVLQDSHARMGRYPN